MNTTVKHVWVLIVCAFAWAYAPGATAQISVQPTLPLYEPTAPFVESDFAWALQPGTGVIAGQGVLRAQGGILMLATGETVTLVPKTPFTDDIVAATRTEGFFDRFDNAKKPPAYEKYRRVVIADDQGYFRFENLPAGEWYIVTRVLWLTSDQLGQSILNGGLMWGQITLKDGEVRDDLKLDSTTELIR